MVDRQARHELAGVLRAFLGEGITAFQFEDALENLAGRTDDATIHEVIGLLEPYYDDFRDYKFEATEATKESWDFFHRILLLVESDGVLEVTKVRRWSMGQLVAVLSLAVFVYFACQVGWGMHLIVLSFPFGVVSMVLAFFKSEVSEPPTRMERALFPFGSVSELLAVRRRVASFVKKPYPASLHPKRIGDPVGNALVWLCSAIMWLMFAPVVLLFQAMPGTERTRRVTMP